MHSQSTDRMLARIVSEDTSFHIRTVKKVMRGDPAVLVSTRKAILAALARRGWTPSPAPESV